MSDTLPALTICQPYPELIMLPDGHPNAKRVENRAWRMDYRGPLVIHAGKSTAWLKGYSGWLPNEPMPFGALVGVVDVVACFDYISIVESRVPAGFSWLRTHDHASGPWCIVLANPRRLAKPIPYKGAQRIFRVSRELIAECLEPARWSTSGT